MHRFSLTLSALVCLIPGHPLYASPLRLDGSSFDLDRLKALISEQKITSVDALLSNPQLPQQCLENQTFVYASGSAQADAVDEIFPRILSYCNDGKMMFALTGNPDRPHFQEMEVIQFKEREARFQFTKIEFGPLGPIYDDSGATCIMCHREDPRPNWDRYSRWFGVYGGFDDLMPPNPDFSTSFLENLPGFRAEQFASESKSKDYATAVEELRTERKSFERFRTSQRQKGRYSFFSYRDSSLIAPYSEEYKGSIQERPNLRFTKLIAQMNSKRVARMLRSSVLFPKYSHVISAEVLRCELPETLRLKVVKTMKADAQARGIKLETSFHFLEPLYELLGTAPSDWSPLAYEPASFEVAFNYKDGLTRMSDLVESQLIYELTESDPDLQRLTTIERVSLTSLPAGYQGADYLFKLLPPVVQKSEELCSALVSRSEKALSK